MKIIKKNLLKIMILLVFAFIIISFVGVEKKNTVQTMVSSVNDKSKLLDHGVIEEIPKGKIIFREDFEASSVDKIITHWDDTKNAKDMSLNNDTPIKSKGKQSLKMTYKPEVNTGGHLFKSFPVGYDSLYARFYVKFLTQESKVHHLIKLGGYNPPTTYPQGRAGIRPNGEDWVISGIEPLDNTWGFYTYWMHMLGKPPNKYWGNTFRPSPLKEIPINKWICVEFMLKMNDPVNEYNGEQAFWINGKKILHLGKGFPLLEGGGNRFENSKGNPFEGFQWRKDKELKLNFFWLNYYMTKGVEGEIDEILFDDIIISTSYIGML
ncbi:MAG: hypothetical protein L3J34_13075 [Flavobacteriaceae bacterium]|nr:hypothetical protein [Flavobacteriaceae bacterium]